MTITPSRLIVLGQAKGRILQSRKRIWGFFFSCRPQKSRYLPLLLNRAPNCPVSLFSACCSSSPPWPKLTGLWMSHQLSQVRYKAPKASPLPCVQPDGAHKESARSNVSKPTSGILRTGEEQRAQGTRSPWTVEKKSLSPFDDNIKSKLLSLTRQDAPCELAPPTQFP